MLCMGTVLLEQTYRHNGRERFTVRLWVGGGGVGGERESMAEFLGEGQCTVAML